MVGIILAGGRGIRFSGFGCCKPLLQINEKYLIEYSLENLAVLHADRVVIVVGKYRDEIIEKIGDRYCGMPVSYVYQPAPKGLIDAFYLAVAQTTEETVILQLSDEVLLEFDPTAVSALNDSDFLCGYTVVSDRKQIMDNYSMSCRSNGRLRACTEKPRRVYNDKKGTGFCVFRPSCIELFRKRYAADASSVKNIGDLINLLISGGLCGRAVRIAAEEINVNTAETFAYARRVIEGGGNE